MIDELKILDNEQTEIETAEIGFDGQKLACIPRECDAYCKRIGTIAGKCTSFGNCSCS